MFMKPYQIESLKRQYPQGTRVKLNSMSGESNMPSGMEGKVDFVDDSGQLIMLWDNRVYGCLLDLKIKYCKRII